MIAAGPRRVFHGLDGLRGIAAVFILFWHAPDPTIARLFPGSYLAVDLFFALSGFVLAHAYAARFERGLTAGAFMTARLVRLYPLYAVAVLIALARIAALQIAGQSMPFPSLVDLATAALFLPTPNAAPPANLYPLNSPAWSLASELVINLVFAVIATRLDQRRLAALLAAGAVMLIATGIHFATLNVGVSWPDAIGGPGRVVYAFFAGIACHRLWTHSRIAWLRLPTWASVAILIAIFAVPDGPWRAAWDIGVALLVIPALILATARDEPSGNAATLFALLGTASYAIYVLHMPIRWWLKTITPSVFHRLYDTFGIGGTIVFAALTIGAALVLDRFYDVPVRAFLTHRLGLSRRAAPAAS